MNLVSLGFDEMNGAGQARGATFSKRSNQSLEPVQYLLRYCW
jgi:hypothetical protein